MTRSLASKGGGAAPSAAAGKSPAAKEAREQGKEGAEAAPRSSKSLPQELLSAVAN